MTTNLATIQVACFGGIGLLSASGLVLYREPVSPQAMGYIAGALGLFALGHAAGGRLPVSRRPAKRVPPEVLNAVIGIGAGLGTIGLGCYVANYFLSGLAGMDAHSARVAMMSDQVPTGSAVLAKTGYYAGPCGLIAACLAVMARHRLSGFLRVLTWLGFLSGPAYSMVMVGRMTIIPTVAAVGLLWVLGKGRKV